MTAKAFRVEADEAGIKDLMNGPGVGEILTGAAQTAAEKIKRRAPFGRAFFDYFRSVRWVAAKPGPDGMEAAVGVDSPGWHLPEYGTANYPATAPIRRGVEEAGIRLETKGPR